MQYVDICHGTTSLLSFLIFVCPPPHLHHLPTPSDLVCLPSAASTPTPRCTHATMLCLHLDYPQTNIGPTQTLSPCHGLPTLSFLYFILPFLHYQYRQT